MTAIWNGNPKTWTTGELVTKTMLDEELRDRMDYLNARPRDNFNDADAVTTTTSSTSYVDVNAGTGKYNLTIVTNGGDVEVTFNGSVKVDNAGATAKMFMTIDVDGADDPADGIFHHQQSANVGVFNSVSFVRRYTGLTAGSHTFKLRWKVQTVNDTASLDNDNATGQFSVREV